MDSERQLALDGARARQADVARLLANERASLEQVQGRVAALEIQAGELDALIRHLEAAS